jgi:hypothetical protein
MMFAKIDLSDGFWRMLVAETDKWNFAYVLPQVDGQPLQLVIPHALQSGVDRKPWLFLCRHQNWTGHAPGPP